MIRPSESLRHGIERKKFGFYAVPLRSRRKSHSAVDGCSIIEGVFTSPTTHLSLQEPVKDSLLYDKQDPVGSKSTMFSTLFLTILLLSVDI